MATSRNHGRGCVDTSNYTLSDRIWLEQQHTAQREALKKVRNRNAKRIAYKARIAKLLQP